MSSFDVTGFWEWVDEARGDMAVLEIEKASWSPRGRISNSYRKKRPSALVCKAIAKGLGLPEETVFRRAGLFEALPGSEDRPTLKQIHELVKHLPDDDLEDLLEFAELRFKKLQDRKRKESPSSNTNHGPAAAGAKA